MSGTPPLGIGQVGLGGITTSHRAGYRLYNQPLIAGFDPSEDARERFRNDAPHARVYDSLEALLDDSDVGVVDISVPHHRDARLPVIRAVAEAGKAMLIQKPLAYTYEEALELCEIVESAGVTAMVNQNMCFTPGSSALIDAVMRDHFVGEPSFAQVTVQYLFDTDQHPWFGRDSRWWTGALTVHHLGLLHLLFGPPETVYAATGNDPSQPGVTSDGFGHALLRYSRGLTVAITSTGTYYGAHPVPHENELLWVQGDAGMLDWQPEGPLSLARRKGTAIERHEVSWGSELTWFPDAFGLTMAHFREAIQVGETPLCSVDDNLFVMAAVEAIYRSSDENRVVPMSEIMGSRWDSSYGPGWNHGYGRWAFPERSLAAS